ncbi:hypothetical protein D9756_001126 [Leucocoprinus leucothites]|uniref:C2H2-type domain-containing protein n=1 Tax=Leucocoprinus leucothites TaxID=201217 RepID=A0A8H5GEW4_9AGAR|nr:hypothetical protein D9756_001126 [Leucoagaricus leucothites]
MSSKPRTTEPPVSLPSIHELFPEHLMHSPQTQGSSRTHPTVPHSSQRHTSSTASSHYRPRAQPPPFSHSSEEAPRAVVGQNYHYASYYPNDDYAHHPRATFAPRPLGAPHVSGPPAEGPSNYPMSRQMPLPHHRDNDQHGRSGHPVVSIPSSLSERPPKSQDPNSYPGAHSITHAGSPHAPPPLDDPENLTDDDTPSNGAPSGIPRKHICPICHKAFNRPSSLKIHYNTHTGATPFRCPWPKCGREFNVNSNMRRHYRNHTTNANQESQDDGARRRRRRSSASSPNPPPSVPVIHQSAGETEPQRQSSPVLRHHATNPLQYDVASSRSPDAPHQYTRYRVYDYTKDHDHAGMDVDTGMDEYHVSEDPHRSSHLPVPVMRASQALVEPRGSEHSTSRYLEAPPSQPQRTLHHHHSHSSTSSSSMRIRALTPGSSFHSSSPSPSPSPSVSSNASPFNSPPPSTLTSPANSPAMLPRTGTHAAGQQQYQYSPSMPYLRSAGDPHVSTALRPAFNARSTRQ